MSRPTSKASSSPFAALQREMLNRDLPPSYADGWRTKEQVAEELGFSNPKSVKSWIRKATKIRPVEVWHGVEAGPDRRRVRTVRYRIPQR